MVLICLQTNLLQPRMLCAKVTCSWNLPNGSGEDEFFKFFNASFEQTSPNDALCQVWLKLDQWFWKKPRNCEKFTKTTRTTTTKTSDNGKEAVSIRPFYSPLIFQERKFNLKVKTLSIIDNWYVNLRYLCFLNSNEMKCSCRKPTIRCTLKCVNTKLMGKFGRVAFINWTLEYELHEGHLSNFTKLLDIHM